MAEPRNKKDIRHTENKEKNSRHICYLIRNCIKCKWTKHSNQNSETDRLD